MFCACSSKSSYQIKSFIFDGVPKYEVYSPIYQDSLSNVDSLLSEKNNKVFVNNRRTNEKISVSIHEPYRERKCSECHNMQNTKNPLKSSDKLCYKCHDNFNTSYLILHGPVASGDCLVCHSPHRAKYKNLLVRSVQNLCLNCHDLDVLGDNNEHKDISKTTCLKCHNPHGGDSNMFLIKNK
ncbi:MAG: hypothetical protein L3J09_06480 [Flavobacteriaceae bacterium]|nr:hypothetical protein [Flavobacteriaceae bacterium]